MVRAMACYPCIGRAVIVVLTLTANNPLFSIVTAGNLRSLKETTTNDSGLSISTERILPCSSESGGVYSGHESLRSRSRHRTGPVERNIFVHHVTPPPTTYPSELPSDLPNNDDEESTFSPSRKPSSSPSSIPSVHPSSIPSSRPSSSVTGSPSKVPTFEPTPVDETTDEPTPGDTDESAAPTTNRVVSQPTYNFTASSIEDFLVRTLSEDGAVNVAGSPQNKALSALQNSSSELDPNDSNDQIEILQRYALNTFYFSTDGENWESNNFWTSSNHPCGIEDENKDIQDMWYGIECDDKEHKIVKKISLDSNGLRGRLPSDIRALSDLNRLEISNNQLSGPITESLGELIKLSVLDVGTNFFTGTIPQSIRNITSLLLLDVSWNYLSGSVATDIAQLTKLLSVSAESNFFEGPLASELFAITSLSKYQCGSCARTYFNFHEICSDSFFSLFNMTLMN